MLPTQLASFVDELEKIAISKEWVEKRTYSGTLKRLSEPNSVHRGDLKELDRRIAAGKIHGPGGMASMRLRYARGPDSLVEFNKRVQARDSRNLNQSITADVTSPKGSQALRRYESGNRISTGMAKAKHDYDLRISPAPTHTPAAAPVRTPAPAAVADKAGKFGRRGKAALIGLGAAAVGAGGYAAYRHLKKGKEKTASNLVSGLEVGGLGVLAAPSFHTLRDKGATSKERSHAKFELAGLGVLGAHPAYELGKAAIGKLRPAAKAMAKAAAADLWHPETGDLSQMSSRLNRANRGISSAVQQVAKKPMPSGHSMLDAIRAAKANYGKGIASVIK